jgi:hypothetical protein
LCYLQIGNKLLPFAPHPQQPRSNPICSHSLITKFQSELLPKLGKHFSLFEQQKFQVERPTMSDARVNFTPRRSQPPANSISSLILACRVRKINPTVCVTAERNLPESIPHRNLWTLGLNASYFYRLCANMSFCTVSLHSNLGAERVSFPAHKEPGKHCR